MRRPQLLITFLVIATMGVAVGVVRAQAQSKKKKKPNPVTLVIEAQVVATTEPMPACGTLATAQRARLRVTRVMRGRSKHALVDVTLPCRNVKVGQRLTVQLGKKPQHGFGWTIVGTLPKPAQPSYWAFGVQ